MAFGDSNWTDDLPQTDHVLFFQKADWSRSGLGPSKEWGTALRLYTHQVMADSRAATIYWGPDHVAIYNENFVVPAAGAHPALMGSTFAQGFPELMSFIGPLFEEGRRSGRAQDVVEAPMMVERSGYREEAFFTGNFTPLRGDSGMIEGFYNALFEVTERVLADRRTRMLNLMATPGDLEARDIYDHIMTSLETAPLDIPMAILYEAKTSRPGNTTLRLRGHIGLPAGHNLLRDGHDLENPFGVIPLCRQAHVTSAPVVIPYDDRFEGIEWRGFKQQSNTIVTAALTTGQRLFGFLVLGTNPCRPYDGFCEQFIRDITRIASSVIASAIDVDFLRKRQRQLEHELEFSDMKIRHLVHHASVGMVHASSNGSIIWANDKFFAVAGDSSSVSPSMDTIYDIFLNDEKPKVEAVWRRVLNGEPHVSAELRLKRLFTPPQGDPEPAYVQILAFPYNEDGVALSGMACTTDISRLKWAEAWQKRLARDAEDAKRQQEAFIDVVSHEMRNPLSAIVHCADSISTSFEEAKAATDLVNVPRAFIQAMKDNVSAASIIMNCTNHQKRMIDDVLTLSRLDSSLLSISPTVVHPSRMVTSVVALFEPELRSTGISTTVTSEPSMAALGIENLYLDPSRVTQVFINLLTNAIKFVKNRRNRMIEVRYGATISSPQQSDMFPAAIYWAPMGQRFSDLTTDAEWGYGESLYLTFSLSDTGIGMSQDEAVQIFDRFRQANVRTHVTYGGSGLGLFISKELTEMMGGAIGVFSTPDQGSLFAFYVKTRRAASPAQIPNLRMPLRTRPHLPGTSTVKEKEERLKVLLVEDNTINQHVLRKHLEKASFTVDVANHGVEALGLLRKPDASFSIILMDVQMPVMDGLTCTAEIRKLEVSGKLNGHIPVIAVTANVRKEQQSAALKAGADRVMGKPFKAAELVSLIRELTANDISRI